jgi:hypothetical protein
MEAALSLYSGRLIGDASGLRRACVARSIKVVLDATVNDLRMAGLPGAARLYLADGVVHPSSVGDAGGVGHAAACPFLKDNTIGPRMELVRRLAAFTNQYPWQWEPAEAEALLPNNYAVPAFWQMSAGK